MSEASPADWVFTGLSPDSGAVDMLLPSGFAAYARLLHPVITDAGDQRRLIRWRDIAPDLVPFDRRVQFREVAAHSGFRAAPFQGNPADEDLDVLLGILASGTATPRACWFCVWDGYGDGGYPRISGPQGRDYWLSGGPLEAARTLRYPPGLWWPDDRAWCVATDIDLDSTYVGGGSELIAGLLAAPDLEVLPSGPHDPVWPTRDAEEGEPGDGERRQGY